MIKEIINDPQYFAGMAFISFETEQDKNECLERNKSTFKDDMEFLLQG